jgi:hypothetical protein
VAFPDEDLELTVEAAFGADITADPGTWSWTDLSERLLSTPIAIRRGVAVGSSTTQTSFATVQLLNDDGHLTPLLASSPYWPYVDAGTPARIRVRHQSDLTDTFTRTVTDGWGTSTSGDVWTPASSATSFSTTGSQAQISIATTNTARQIRADRVFRDVDLVFDVAVNSVATGAAHSIGPNLRYSGSGLYRLWCTAELGLAGAVALRVRQYVNSVGTSTTLANVTVPVLTYSAGTLIRVRVRLDGDSVRMRAWLASGSEPTTWHVDLTQTAITGREGALAATDVLGMQATVFSGYTGALPVVFTVDNLTAAQLHSDRLEGYISDVRPAFMPLPDGETHSTVQIDISGVGSRLEKNQAPAWSPMRRSIQLADIPPIAYWPLEDPEGSLTAAPAFPGDKAMGATGPVVFGFASGVPTEQYLSRYGTKPLASLAAGARLSVQVPSTSGATQWSVALTSEMYTPEVPAVTEIRIMEWQTPGTYNRWALVGTATGYQVRAYNDTAGTSTNVCTYAGGAYGVQIDFEVEAVQSGGQINVDLQIDSNSHASGSVTGTVGGTPTRVTLNPDRVNTTASVTPRGLRFIAGHLRIFDNVLASALPFYYDTEQNSLLLRGDTAWYQESAHQRIKRLCQEERVPITILGDPATTGLTQLNAQQDGTFTELVEAAAESESGGLLYEAGFGYHYLPRSTRCNIGVALTVDMATYAHSGDAAEVLVPQLDSRAPTYWTVQRTDGSSGSWQASEEYRQRRGTIREEVTVDVLRDEDLEAHAAWRGHLGVDATEARYPTLQIDLAANPDLVEDWLDCDIGSRVQRTNQPTIAGIGVIDQLIDGYTETLSPRGWSVSANCAPASPWDVALVDDSDARVDTDGSELAAGATASATSLQVAVTDGPLWTTDPAEFPFDAYIDGIRVTVTAIAGATSPQTWTVVRGVDGFDKALPLGAQVRLWTPAYISL